MTITLLSRQDQAQQEDHPLPKNYLILAEYIEQEPDSAMGRVKYVSYHGQIDRNMTLRHRELPLHFEPV